MITIITPVLNGAKYLQFNIDSVAQLQIPYEHIIVDGGSTDGTVNLIKKHSNVIFIAQDERPGMYGAIDQGIELATGKYITWINADDYIIPNGFETMYKECIKGNYGFVYSNSVLHYMELYKYKKVFAKHFARYFLKEGVFSIIQPSSMFSKQAYIKTGGLNYKNLKLIGDRDLFQKMAYDESITFKYINVFSTVFLRYSESLLYSNLDKINNERIYCIKTNLSIFNRTLFHLSQTLKHTFWLLSTRKINSL